MKRLQNLLARFGPLAVALVVLATMFAVSSVGEAKTRKKKKDPPGTGFFFRWGMGVGDCLDSTQLCKEEITPSFTPAHIEFGYRPGVVSFAGHLMLQPLSPDSSPQDPNNNNNNNTNNGDNEIDGSGFAWGIFADLKLMPVLRGRADPYVGLRLGFMQMSFQDNPDVQDQLGLGLGVVGGIDYLLTRNFAIGASAAYYSLEGDAERQQIWSTTASIIFYFDLSGGSSKKKAKRSKRRKPRRIKRRKRPSY